MRILLVNKFIPPDGAPTSRLLAELGAGLSEAGPDVDYLGAVSGYHQQKVRGWRRWLRDLQAHLKLLLMGMSTPRPDWILCLSDPPGLVFTAALLAKLRGARLAHWAMDVYPEVAIALGEIGKGKLASLVSQAMCFGYRQAELLVALDEDMAAVLEKASGRKAAIMPPWPPLPKPGDSLSAPSKDNSTLRWLYSGNLGRAHDYETLLQTQKILEATDAGWELVFQGGGPAREAAQARADELGLRRCHWLDYAPADALIGSLSSAHVLIATQKVETQGLLWPSKMALMWHLPRAIVWIGPVPGAMAGRIAQREAASYAVLCGASQSLASWLTEQRSSILALSHAAVNPEQWRESLSGQAVQSVQWWCQQLDLPSQ
jgi:colanic acid biosynthesis glycosyl transferase WcaI